MLVHTRSCRVWRRIVPSKAWIHFSRSSASRAEGETQTHPVSHDLHMRAQTHTQNKDSVHFCDTCDTNGAAGVLLMQGHRQVRGVFLVLSTILLKKGETQKTCNTHNRLRQKRNIFYTVHATTWKTKSKTLRNYRHYTTDCFVTSHSHLTRCVVVAWQL